MEKDQTKHKTKQNIIIRRSSKILFFLSFRVFFVTRSSYIKIPCSYARRPSFLFFFLFLHSVTNPSYSVLWSLFLLSFFCFLFYFLSLFFPLHRSCSDFFFSCVHCEMPPRMHYSALRVYCSLTYSSLYRFSHYLLSYVHCTFFLACMPSITATITHHFTLTHD